MAACVCVQKFGNMDAAFVQAWTWAVWAFLEQHLEEPAVYEAPPAPLMSAFAPEQMCQTFGILTEAFTNWKLTHYREREKVAKLKAQNAHLNDKLHATKAELDAAKDELERFKSMPVAAAVRQDGTQSAAQGTPDPAQLVQAAADDLGDVLTGSGGCTAVALKKLMGSSAPSVSKLNDALSHVQATYDFRNKSAGVKDEAWHIKVIQHAVKAANWDLHKVNKNTVLLSELLEKGRYLLIGYTNNQWYMPGSEDPEPLKYPDHPPDGASAMDYAWLHSVAVIDGVFHDYGDTFPLSALWLQDDNEVDTRGYFYRICNVYKLTPKDDVVKEKNLPVENANEAYASGAVPPYPHSAYADEVEIGWPREAPMFMWKKSRILTKKQKKQPLGKGMDKGELRWIFLGHIVKQSRPPPKRRGSP